MNIPMKRKLPIKVCCLLLPLTIAACGGGSSGGSKDLTPPTIEMKGAETVSVGYGTSYQDLGAEAQDAVDGQVSVSVTGSVNTSIENVGKSFEITYTAIDAAGNTSTATRTVTVVDLVEPTLALVGEEKVEALLNRGDYQDLGAHAMDEVDGIVAVSVDASEVDTTKVGEYKVRYTAKDQAGNGTFIFRTVTVREPTPMITSWTTSNAGKSDDYTIQINVDSANPDYTYDYSVDWGDGNKSENLTDSTSHTYSESGTYSVTINGHFPTIVFPAGNSDPAKLVAVDQWGEIEWKSMTASFKGASNLVIKATDTPDLSQVTDLDETFSGASELTGGVKDWDVSTITSMVRTFSNASKFNEDISSWDVSNVTDTNYMFYEATIFNQPLNTWNVSKVTKMSGMFASQAYVGRKMAFNQPLDNWDVSSVTDMRNMFGNSTSFNQPLNDWDVSNVTLIGAMFHFTRFNQPLDKWDVSSVTDMSQLFRSSRFNQPLEDWDVSNVSTMAYMFEDAHFNQPLAKWNVSAVRNMKRMFKSTPYFNQPLNGWDVSSVGNMERMFESAVYNLSLAGWVVTSVGNMNEMFKNNRKFNQPLGSWNLKNVRSMNGIFANSGLSSSNYDDFLIGMSNKETTAKNVFQLGAHGKKYSSTAKAARDKLVNDFKWTIVDGGCLDCTP